MLPLDQMDRHPQNEDVTAVRTTGDKRSSRLERKAVGRLADGQSHCSRFGKVDQGDDDGLGRGFRWVNHSCSCS